MITNRKEIIKRYEKIVNKWDKDPDLKRLFPDKYVDICRKLEALKTGVNYIIKDVTKECITAGGILLGSSIPLTNNLRLGQTKKYQDGIKKFKIEDIEN